ncbi:MAG TPA: hypothetical protein DCO68_07020 [Methylophilaceae bacterium]|nr:hypothetical protein [Methylophilaceae bacterium]
MQFEQNSQQAQQRKGRMIFIMMAIFFAVPIVVVVLMYKLDWRPSGQSYGELVQPPRMITASHNLQDAESKSQDKFWQDKWNMVFVAGQCNAICLEKLHDMRQIYVSTYKDMLRVQRVLVTAQQDVREIRSMYPDMLIINQPTSDVIQLAAQFNIAHENAMKTNRIYFVDPLGHVMMSYVKETPAVHIRKDLVKLLRYSWAG